MQEDSISYIGVDASKTKHAIAIAETGCGRATMSGLLRMRETSSEKAVSRTWWLARGAR